MTDQDVAKNEQGLQAFLQKTDKQFVYRVGMTSLALLTEQLSPEQYEAFLLIASITLLSCKNTKC